MTFRPPTDLDRLGSAWAHLQLVVNQYLPSYAQRVVAVLLRVVTLRPPTPPA